MNCHHQPNLQRGGRPHAGMSLLEMIGVLGIVAVLAAAGLPSAIRILDRIASEREVASMGQMGDSLQNGILRVRSITNAEYWDGFIANEAGMDLMSVIRNSRRRDRAFLYDRSGWLKNNLPYFQTNNTPPGLAAPPAKARMMIVSSLGAALPAGLNNTDLSYSAFDAMWNAPENTLPTGTPLDGWNGRAEDLKIQRVNLSPLFVKVVLSTYIATNWGRYKIDNYPTVYQAPNGGVSGYFLKDTVLSLYSALGDLQHSETLERDTSYVYENGIWRNTIQGAVATGLGDVSGIVDAFLKAPGNINAAVTNPPKHQQYIIVTNFIAYMSNYNAWEDGGFPNNALKTYLNSTLQPAMMQAVQNLYLNSAGHYPTNNYEPCVDVIAP